MNLTSIKAWRLGAFAAVFLAGCAANPAQNLPSLDSAPLTTYQLDSGDRVRVVIYGHENVPVEYTLDDQGFISVPLAHRIKAQNLTTGELESAIAQRLQGVLVDPSVSVQVLSSRPVYVAGGVNQPGSYPYSKNMTVLAAVSMAQGFTDGAYEDTMKVMRFSEDGAMKEWRATQTTYLRPDDIVYVYEKY